MKKLTTNKVGFSPLFCILIISAAALIIATNSAVIGQGEMDLSIASGNGKMALDLADSCANESLQRIRTIPDYEVASTSLRVGDGLCIISISELLSGEKKILIQSIYNEYYRQVSIKLNIIDDFLTIHEWKEY